MMTRQQAEEWFDNNGVVEFKSADQLYIYSFTYQGKTWRLGVDAANNYPGSRQVSVAKEILARTYEREAKRERSLTIVLK